MHSFRESLRVQRWDDHRYYHHSRVNQSLHLVSALSFLVAYLMVFIDPPKAGLIGWLISMVSRQSGHFFFEPKTYDFVNKATHEFKEDIKVGYNLRRKIILMSIWALVPAVFLVDPSLFGLLLPARGAGDVIDRVGMSWLLLGVAGLLFRTLHLFVIRDVQTGIVWMIKILTDPFNDIRLYHGAPFRLLKGEWVDPMTDVLEAEELHA